ncbi:MAG: hypothetical protein IJD07_04935 [Clostridia bacterium]|nr:hypothetical protein [Clostridia bacterium]
MAIIQCPECGKEVSSMAKNCPNCGFPIKVAATSNIVTIRMAMIKGTVVFGAKQKVDITVGSKIVWQGHSGEIAELTIDKPTEIQVKYYTNAAYFGGRCSGMVDPKKYKKYSVTPHQGALFKTNLTFQPVDVFDSD